MMPSCCAGGLWWGAPPTTSFLPDLIAIPVLPSLMAPPPSKSPAFAVCGSFTMASEPSPRSCHPRPRKKPPSPDTPLPPSPSPSPLPNPPDDLYADVFGGPPKFAALSSQFSQLSFKLGPATVSDASLDTLSPPSLPSAVPPSIASTAHHASSPHVRFSSQARKHGLPHAACSDSVKLRPTAEAVMASPTCGRDNGRKDQPEDIRMSSLKNNDVWCPNRSRESTTESKPLTRGGSSLTGSKVGSSPGMFFLEKKCDHAQKYACSHCNRKIERRRFSSKDKIKGNINQHWITVKDVRFSTVPSKFPPPSRPPPVLSSCSDNCVSTNLMEDRGKPLDEALERNRRNVDEDSNFSKFECIESDSTHHKIDVMEMAEVKLKTAMEAKKKARLIVEKRLRDKRRERHQKNMNDPMSNMNKDQWCKNISIPIKGIRENLGVSHCNDVRFERRETITIQEKKDEAVTKPKGTISFDTKDGTNSTNANDQLLGEGHPVSILSFHSNEVRMETAPRFGRHLSERDDYDTRRRYTEKELKIDTRKCDVPESREKKQDSLITNSGECWNDTDADSKNVVFAVVDVHRDLSLDPGSTPPEILFPVVEGHTEDRQKARWERTSARMAKALEEKKLRDLEIEREQAERHRAGEMLDDEIKNWAAGKEGNLQALLCSLQYILWPECGWQPVSPADILTTAALKKSYRKATLCVHPDKLQQRGATIMQKYIAEKVFDLLKEASFRSM